MSRPDMSRRRFLGTAAGAGIGVAAASAIGPLASPASAAMGVAAPDRASSEVGTQLFNYIGYWFSGGAWAPLFEELARQGYTSVEFFGAYGSIGAPTTDQTIIDLRKALDDNGLKAIGSHLQLSQLRTNLAQQLDWAQILGLPYVGTAEDFPGQTVDAVKAGAAEFNTWGAAAAARGMKLYQHNHTNEFAYTSDQPSVRRYDVFLQNTDPSLVYLEMDILWAYGGARKFGGFDPADYVAAAPQRYPLFHVKDGVPLANPQEGNSYNPVEFGQGTIPFREFFARVGAKSMHTPIWEQDTAGNTPASEGGALGASERSLRAVERMRTITWLDELVAMVNRYEAEGKVKPATADQLNDRLRRALSTFETGSEVRPIGYLEQFIAKARNQVKGSLAARELLVANAQELLAWIRTAENRENA
jgi:sugar phosphate isomerase/epimerase